MPRGGHNRLSDAEKRRRGTFRPSRGEEARSKPRVIRQPPPRLPPAPLKPHWSLTAAEVAIWNEVCPQVTARDEDTYAVLSAYCAVAVRIVGNPTSSTADLEQRDELAAQLGLRSRRSRHP
jgi:hypothetical protein